MLWPHELSDRPPLTPSTLDERKDPVDSLLNPIAFATLLTSLYVLRFRGWRRPGAVALYFAFFAALEVVATRYFLPAGAFGPLLGKVCLGLTLPVLLAAYLVWRHERNEGEAGDD